MTGSGQKPAVLVFRSNFLPKSETFIRDHLVGLQRWRPIVAYKKQVDDAARTIGIPAYRIYPSRLRRFSEWWMAKVGLNPQLGAVLRKHKVGLIHAHFLHDGARLAAAARRYRLPLVVTAHGHDATLYEHARKQTAGGRFLLAMTPALRETADVVICVSDFIREELVKQGWPAEKLRTVPLGVDLGAIQPGLPAADREGLVYVGRLVEKKGARYLIQALARLPDTLRQTRLTIVGDGPLRAELEAMAKDLAVNVDFRGAQPRDVGLDLMGASQALVLSSIRADTGDAEGLPIVSMEAQARGCPIVMFDCGSASSAIADGRSGLLAKDRDIEDLAAKLAMILNDRAFAAKLGEHGPRVVRERFDLGANMAKLEALYDEVVADYRNRHQAAA